MTTHRKTLAAAFLALGALAVSLCGCAATGPGALDTHQKKVGAALDEEYFVPKKPVDRAYIGCAWSRQFGPIDDAAAADIRTKKERSLNDIQQDFAYSRGIALGGKVVGAAQGGLSVGRSGLGKTKFEGVEVIAPVSLADIPFEPDVAYVTEALRLANFRISDEKARRAELTGRKEETLANPLDLLMATGATTSGGTSAAAGGSLGGGSQSRTATGGEGLVVAYRLHTIDTKTYQKKESGSLRLELDKSVDVPSAGVILKARLDVIEPGSGKSLPRNLLWACPQAEARRRDVTAAWLVDIRPFDPKRKSLTIALPAHPKFDDCQGWGGIVYSRIDPATDRIVRQKIQLTVVDASITDDFRPKEWDARATTLDESFNVRQVRPDEMSQK